MTNTKHTPGPWTAVTEFDGRHGHFPIMAQWDCPEEQEPHHPKIASISSSRAGVPVEIAKANARLIAAAPMMLDALKQIEACKAAFQGGNRNGGLMGDISLAMDAAAAAIAKATGGQP